MNDLIPIKRLIPESDSLESIHHTLNLIKLQFLEELSSKQDLLDKKEQEINTLKIALEEKNKAIEELNLKVAQVERNNEGNRQLNRKLINELVRKQQDIEWYKRTYEQRSFLGTIKQRILEKLF
ncbi:hypothetical protein [Rufibacter latericius]|uniref:Uncharacterized protein n=1 Tax=Rufibacter latericius TaxID=2487040 RepID=A0A3M9MVN1_9BACT|nr:hypothetical protein [Rufibacter latericius]RNI29235.1 hypothetical protein EFB08_07385 [Rufibacter latericius]